MKSEELEINEYKVILIFPQSEEQIIKTTEIKKSLYQTLPQSIAELKTLINTYTGDWGIFLIKEGTIFCAIKGKLIVTLKRKYAVTPILVGETLAKGLKGKLIAGDILEVEMGDKKEKLEWQQADSLEAEKPIVFVKKPKEPGRYQKLGLIILLVFLCLVGVGAVRRTQVVEKQKYGTLEEKILGNLDLARTVVTENPKQAEQLIEETKLLVDQFENKEKTKYQKEIVLFREQIQKTGNEIFRKNEIELTTLAELSIFEPTNVKPQIQIDQAGFLFLDTGSKLIGINTSDKSQINLGDSPKDNLGFFLTERNVLWLFKEKILSTSRRTQDELKEIIKADETWQEPKLISSFANNIYVLDTSQNEIAKYSSTENGYNDRKRWLGVGVVPDLSKIIDWVVDGDVWLLSSSGNVWHYARGNAVKYVISGMPSSEGGMIFREPVAITTTDNEIYVLEPMNERVVVVGKDGKFVKQYLAKNISTAKDMAIYQDRIYLLTDRAIVSFPK